MALTAGQQAKVDELKAQIDEVEAGVKEIEDVVYNSLSIRNVGGGHVFNLALVAKQKIQRLKDKLAEVEAAE